MPLISNWKKVAKKSWSVQLLYVASALTAIEAALPYFSEDIPRRPFGLLTFVVVGGALLARFLYQESLHDDEP